ncbi:MULTISPECIES: hypothetical protein [Streptomyces violaceusniger group]|uniref:DUF4352 domain-containing protein n=2 Tax=Streptomyces rhizosphaericus TaxID=114699 RepID=A0ABN1QAT1_9ACTN|nr:MULTISPECIES: hypothetical protein [Streptomyces violaceusniger group]
MCNQNWSTKTPASVTHSPSRGRGDKALGWIVIEVPKASKVATLQFTMNSGFADETGQWKIS